MAAGPLQIQVKDAGNVTRNVWVFSDDGTITGNLSFMQTLMGVDGATRATAANPVPVVIDGGNVTVGNVSISGGNLTSAGNVTVTNGNLTSAGNVTAILGALPAGTNVLGALSANQTVQVTNTVNANITGGNITATPIGNQSVIGPTADGTAASTAPVLIAGTADGTGTGAVSVPQISATGQVATNIAQVGNATILTGTGATGTGAQRVTVAVDSATVAGSASLPAGTNLIGKTGVDQTTPGTTNAVAIAQIGATTIVTGGVNGSQGVGGLAASGVAVAGNPLLSGGRAQSAEPTAVTNAQAVSEALDLTGKTITSPYANRENYLRGGNTTGNTTAMQLLPSSGASVKTYITDINIGNTGNTTVNVSFNDTASTVLIAPSGGGNNPAINVPLVTAAATALTATLSGNSASVSVFVRGYSGY